MKELLLDTGRFSNVRTSFSPSEARTELQHFKPDLIFLDVRMPGQDGISLLRELNALDRYAEVIFVTAHMEYTLDALKGHAFGYLLKPVNRAELIECIEYYVTHRNPNERSARIEKLIHALQQPHRIRINTKHGFYFVNIQDILFLEADGNYTRIELGTKSYLCSMNMKTLFSMLPADMFIRLGRSRVVNTHKICQVDRKKQKLTFGQDSNAFDLSLSRSELRDLDP